MNSPSEGIVCCVLAGGLSRRMGGGDKTLMPLSGKPMLQHILNRLSPQAQTIILNANGDPARFADFQRTVVPDPIDGFAGPLAGILAGLLWTRANHSEIDRVVTVAGDTPFFPETLVKELVAATDTGKPVIGLASSHHKLHPVFGIWPVALADDLLEWLINGNNGKVLAWVDRHDSVEVAFAANGNNGGDPFFNINKPGDLDLAESLLKESA